MIDADFHSELLTLYLTECEQLLQKFEHIVLDADQREELTDTAELFRIVHTFKGSSAMMDYTPLVETAHGFESILAVIKAAAQPLRGERLVSLLDVGLAFLAYCRTQLSCIHDGLAPTADAALCDRIARLGDAEDGPVTTESARTRRPAADTASSCRDGEIRVQITLKTCPLPHIRAGIIVKSVAGLCSYLMTVPGKPEKADSDRIQSEGFAIGFLPAESVPAKDVIKKLSAQPYVLSVAVTHGMEAAEVTAPDKTDADSAQVDPFQNVLVAQPIVNQLIDFLSEIAFAETALEACAREEGFASRGLSERFSALRHTIADANILASQIGMHSMDSVFLQMQRAMRGMAKELHKEVRIQTVGADIQVDKSVLDILSDSLIHIVRNAMDHGIESPETRLLAGKPKAGLITLHADKRNETLTVTVTDDGAGIDFTEVLNRAEQHHKLTKPRLQYSESEALQLLLSSGVSTTDTVTQYSGRGVGLSAVVRRLQQAGGTVSIDSAPGQGTTFTLKIPITLLMIDGIRISLDSGAELIVPASAIRRISRCDGAPEQIVLSGDRYVHLPFPGERETQAEGPGYALLLTLDYGLFYIRAKRVSMMSTYYVKQLPEYVAAALGKHYVFSGCVLSSDTRLYCVLDAGKLLDASMTGEYLERQENQ